MNSGAKEAFSYTACQRTVTSKPLYSECLSRVFTVLAKLVRLGSYCARWLGKHLFAGTHMGVGCPRAYAAGGNRRSYSFLTTE